MCVYKRGKSETEDPETWAIGEVTSLSLGLKIIIWTRNGLEKASAQPASI